MENMEREEKGEAFVYNYSAEKQREIENIREKYTAHNPQEDALEKLKSMDRQAEKNAAKQPILMGALGCLFLGLGMCGTMVLYGRLFFVLGVIVGVLGIIMMAASYPLYAKRIKMEREKIAPEILRIADEAGR